MTAEKTERMPVQVAEAVIAYGGGNVRLKIIVDKTGAAPQYYFGCVQSRDGKENSYQTLADGGDARVGKGIKKLFIVKRNDDAHGRANHYKQEQPKKTPLVLEDVPQVNPKR